MTRTETARPADAALPADTFPVKPGDWVASAGDRVAKVKDVYRVGGDLCVDLWLYGYDGTRSGRDSPALGGPRTFEPACDWRGWHRIAEPSFPMALAWVPDGEGNGVARRVTEPLPDRAWSKPIPRAAWKTVRTDGVAGGNLDAEAQARALRIAAQELRDIARNLGRADPTSEALRARAKTLEDRADQISPRQ